MNGETAPPPVLVHFFLYETACPTVRQAKACLLRIEAAAPALTRHPEVPERSEGLEGRRPRKAWPCILRGSPGSRPGSHLRMTERRCDSVYSNRALGRVLINELRERARPMSASRRIADLK